MNDGKTYAQAWCKNLKGCSVAAKEYVSSALKAGKSADEIAVGLQNLSSKSKLATAGLKALAVAGNMLVSLGISALVSGLISFVSKVVSFKKELEEAQEQRVEQNKQELSTLNDQISQYQKLKQEQLNGNNVTEEMLTLQESIKSTLGVNTD